MIYLELTLDFREVYRADVKPDLAVSKQSYTLYLGGLQRENLAEEVAEGLTVSGLARRAGVRMVGFLVEYQLDDVEDLKIISLLLQPAGESKYICECLRDRTKMPLHIFRGTTEYTLKQLSTVCPCNINFHLYSK